MTAKFKICLLGAAGVGKSSLLQRFVHSIFSEAYRTTIGVKIESLDVRRDGETYTLVIWDLSGEDEFQSVQVNYLQGCAGYLLVVDGTRRATVGTAVSLQERATKVVGDAPCVVLLNKADLVASWELMPADLQPLTAHAYRVVTTSAKTGAGVDLSFQHLIDAMVEQRRGLLWI